MSGKIIGRLLLIAATACGLGAGLSACTSISLDEPAPVVDSVPANVVRAPARAPVEPQPQPVEVAAPIVEAVTMPDVVAGQQPVSIALLLPRRSESLAQVSEAVRAGFMAAYQFEPGNITVNLIETGDSVQDTLSGYQNAVQQNDIVVGPLTRTGTAALAQNRIVTKPTIALTQLNTTDDAGLVIPDNMLMMGLSLEDEAHQVATWAGARLSAKAFVVSTNVPWQRRAAAAFVAQWSAQGLQAESMQLSLTGGYLNANALVQLKQRLQAENPTLIFVALDAIQTAQLRSAIGNDIDIYGTSQLNPLTLTDWDAAEPKMELEGVRLLDIPWQLQADHAAVMAYPRLPAVAGQRRSPDIERLYALGIDAYRVAHNIALAQKDFQIDGVTGKLTAHFGYGKSQFERVEQPAAYVQGKVKALEAQ